MDNLKNPTWWNAALTRCIKTFAQTFVGALGTNAIGITECDWLGIGSLAAMASFISLMTSLAGLPEVDGGH